MPYTQWCFSTLTSSAWCSRVPQAPSSSRCACSASRRSPRWTPWCGSGRWWRGRWRGATTGRRSTCCRDWWVAAGWETPAGGAGDGPGCASPCTRAHVHPTSSFPAALCTAWYSRAVCLRPEASAGQLVVRRACAPRLHLYLQRTSVMVPHGAMEASQHRRRPAGTTPPPTHPPPTHPRQTFTCIWYCSKRRTPPPFPLPRHMGLDCKRWPWASGTT